MKEMSDVFSEFDNVFGLHLIHQWLIFRFLMFRHQNNILMLDIKKAESQK